MSSTSLNNPGLKLNIHPAVKKQIQNRNLNKIKNSGYGQSKQKRTHDYSANIAKRKKEDAEARKKSQSNSGGGNNNESEESSSGDGIISGEDAGMDMLSGGDSSSEGTSGATSPLLSGDMTFEELIAEICDGIDLIFAVKRSTVVITDYENLYAEAKYLRDKHHESVKAEDMALWQLEEDSYELDIAEYGFYNTVKIHYNKGTVTESYDDLVNVYGEVTAEYNEPELDKTSAIMKAKAYLAAHVRDFDMTVKATVLHDGDIDIGDIVTLDNPMTLRDENRQLKEHRDPEYFFVSANSVSWDGDSFIKNDIELRYGAESPNKKDIPETGSPGYTNSSGNAESAVQEIGQLYSGYSYCHACQTATCVKEKKCGDCYGMSDLISCELTARGIKNRILQYSSSYATSGTHRSVQYLDASGTWQDFPYSSLGFNSLFNTLSNVNSGKEINSTCGGN